MARRRAVVVNHAAGRSGIPSRAQLVSARSAASATESSARSQSPVVRISEAMMRSRSAAIASARARRTTGAAPPPCVTASDRRVWNGRSSSRPNRAIGCCDAMAIASSRSAHSRMSKPAIHSRVSANGPSVTSTLPPRLRTVVASATGRSASPITRAPLASWRSTQSSTSSNFGSPEGGSGSVSVQTNIMYFMSGSFGRFDVVTPTRRSKRPESDNSFGISIALMLRVDVGDQTSAGARRRHSARGNSAGSAVTTCTHTWLAPASRWAWTRLAIVASSPHT